MNVLDKNQGFYTDDQKMIVYHFWDKKDYLRNLTI